MIFPFPSHISPLRLRKGVRGMVVVCLPACRPRATPCIPCEHRFARSRPLTQAKGMVASPLFPSHPLWIPPEWRVLNHDCHDGGMIAVIFPSRPLWIPAYAGMTCVRGNGGGRFPPSRSVRGLGGCWLSLGFGVLCCRDGSVGYGNCGV